MTLRILIYTDSAPGLLAIRHMRELLQMIRRCYGDNAIVRRVFCSRNLYSFDLKVNFEESCQAPR